MSTLIKHAATVVVARDTRNDGIEIYLQQRQATMEYAANMIVFPGGGVEPVDRPSETMFDPATRKEAGLLQTTPDLIASNRSAARRELNEETGIDLNEHEHQLLPLDRWITPDLAEFKRRYDALTFILDCVEEFYPQNLTTEATNSFWASPAHVLDRWSRGEVRLLPPTWWHLKQFARYNTVAGLVASAREDTRTTVFSDWKADPQDMAEFYERASVYGRHLTSVQTYPGR